MKAVMLNGALRGDEGLIGVEQSVVAALAGRGWDVEPIHLRELTIAYCQGCFECWVKTPGVCKIKDAGPDVTRAILRSDLLVLLSPVTFGGYSSEVKKALDRSIGLVLPLFTRVHGEVHHERRYARYPALLGIGVLAAPDADEERIFSTLVERNAINFYLPAHVSGFVYRGQPDRVGATIGELVERATRRRGAA